MRDWARENFAAWSLKSEDELDWLVTAARQDTGVIRIGATIVTVIVAVLAGGWLRAMMFPTRSDSAIDGGIVAGFTGMAGAYVGIMIGSLIVKHRLRKIAEFENRESSHQ